jgi:hypothetical protein
MSKVGPFTLGKKLFMDSNLAYVHGESKEHGDVLLVFMADKVISASSKELEEELIPAQKRAEFNFVKEPFSQNIPGLLPLLGKGRIEGYLILAYPFVNAIPFYVYMKTVPTIHRRVVLRYIMEVVSILELLHGYKLRSTEVNIGNVFIDDEEKLYLTYNYLTEESTFLSEVLKKHPQVKRFDVVTPEEVWGNGADDCSDVFQAGALAVTMLTRRVLKLSSNVRKMGYSAVTEGHYPPEDFTEGLPKALGKCILTALKPDPVDRFESSGDLLRGLKEVAEASKITDAVSAVMDKGYLRSEKAVSLQEKSEEKEPQVKIEDDVKVPDIDSRAQRKSPKKSSGTSASLIPKEYEQFKVPAIGVLALFLILFVMWPSGGDEPFISPRQVKEPVQATVKTNSPTKNSSKEPAKVNQVIVATASKSSGTKDENIIDVTSITADLNEAISRPTDGSTFVARKALLQKCYRMLPREHRGKAIRSSVFQLLYEHEKNDKEKAYKFVDETFQKYIDYLRSNNARM